MNKTEETDVIIEAHIAEAEMRHKLMFNSDIVFDSLLGDSL